MRRLLRGALFAAVVAGPAAGATFQIVGKTVDAAGNPIADATVKATNAVNASAVGEAKSDKKGNYYLAGLLYSEQAKNWTVTAVAAGLELKSAKVVGRGSDRSIFAEFEKKFRPGDELVPITVRGFAEVRIEFTLGPPTSTAAQAPGLESELGGGAQSDPTLTQARAKIKEGDFEAAVDLMAKAVETAPDDLERRELYARVLLKADRSSEAIQQANKVTAAAPDRIEPYLVVSDAWTSKEQMDKAMAALEKASSIAADDPRILTRIAYVAPKAGKLDRAIAASEKLVAAKPDDAEAWVGLGELYMSAGQSSKSEEAFRKVVDLDPANAYRTFYNIGVSIGNRADLTDADNRKIVEATRRSIELKGDFAPAHRQLAYALLRAGDLAGAKASLEKYLQVDPKAADAAEVRATLKSLSSVKAGRS